MQQVLRVATAARIKGVLTPESSADHFNHNCADGDQVMVQIRLARSIELAIRDIYEGHQTVKLSVTLLPSSVLDRDSKVGKSLLHTQECCFAIALLSVHAALNDKGGGLVGRVLSMTEDLLNYCASLLEETQIPVRGSCIGQ